MLHVAKFLSNTMYEQGSRPVEHTTKHWNQCIEFTEEGDWHHKVAKICNLDAAQRKPSKLDMGIS